MLRTIFLPKRDVGCQGIFSVNIHLIILDMKPELVEIISRNFEVNLPVKSPTSNQVEYKYYSTDADWYKTSQYWTIKLNESKMSAVFLYQSYIHKL